MLGSLGLNPALQPSGCATLGQGSLDLISDEASLDLICTTGIITFLVNTEWDNAYKMPHV